MSLIQKSDNLHQNNLHIRRSTQVPNTAMNLTKLTKNEVDNNDNSHFYKEPLDDISHYEHQSMQRKYHFVQSPQINSLKSSKFYFISYYVLLILLSIKIFLYYLFSITAGIFMLLFGSFFSSAFSFFIRDDNNFSFIFFSYNERRDINYLISSSFI